MGQRIRTAGQTCAVVECSAAVHCRGLCNKHYLRMRHRDGDLSDPAPRPTSCSVDECSRQPASYGLCNTHRMRVRRTGSVDLAIRVDVVCDVSGCLDTSYGRGWCRKHYLRWYDHGDPLHRIPGEVRNGMKVCALCADDLPLDQYGVDRSLPHGRAIYCRDCNCAKAHARRASIRKTRIEPVSRARVMERDGWICQLCQTPIDSGAPWPMPLSPSLDHRIPLVHGGSHTYENCQASHLRCNLQKGAQLPSP